MPTRLRYSIRAASSSAAAMPNCWPETASTRRCITCNSANRRPLPNDWLVPAKAGMTEIDGAGRIPAATLVRRPSPAVVDVAAGRTVRGRFRIATHTVSPRLAARAQAARTRRCGRQHRRRWRRQNAVDDCTGGRLACARIQAGRGEPRLRRRGAHAPVARCAPRSRRGRRRTRVGPHAYWRAGRADAARLLLGEKVDVIIADDGLQHYALARDIEICVVDGARRLGNERLLPAGPLREPASRLREVEFVVCNGGAPHAGEISMRLVLDEAIELVEPGRTRSLDGFSGQRVHAVAGIGHPPRFFDALRAAGLEVIEHPFPDHHHYSISDFDFGGLLPVLMTEKDAVKCRPFARENWWAVPATAVLPASFLDQLAVRMRR